ncbi:MAG: GNAT family N-acetyltransferase [Clostridia bacterium]|nr:GNAT family N-acetyltransferase [Clostridia bacterium]
MKNENYNENIIISDAKLDLSDHTLKTYTLYRCDKLIKKTANGKMLLADKCPEAKSLLSSMASSLGLSVSEEEINSFSDGENGLYIWDDSGICAIARIAFVGKKYARINTVYTSPEKRGHGYAGALVSSLSELLIGRGLIPTVLADENNPISNKMYLSLGFIPDGKIYEYTKNDVPKKECAIFNLRK